MYKLAGVLPAADPEVTDTFCCCEQSCSVCGVGCSLTCFSLWGVVNKDNVELGVKRPEESGEEAVWQAPVLLPFHCSGRGYWVCTSSTSWTQDGLAA